MKVHFHRHGGRERGYILLVLLLTVALLSIALLAGVQSIAFEIKRDREEEMIHRGTQYSRAIRLFVQKFHRYPASIEELQNTNNIRFLRKRYKDPITGKDFKLLYMDKVAAFYRPPVPQPPQPNESTGGTISAEDAAAEAERQAVAAYDNVKPAASGGDSPDTAGASAFAAATNGNSGDDENNVAPPLKGVPIVGVASLSEKETIREFDKKNHYNQWLFIFNANNSDSASGLIKTPDQPSLLLHRTAQAAGLQNENSTEGAGTNPSE